MTETNPDKTPQENDKKGRPGQILHFLFNIDHLFVALISLIFTTILFSICSLNISFLNPVRRAFTDFSMSDVYYSILWQGKDAQESKLITLVDLDTLYQRKDISSVIEQIDQYQPKVVGVDILFEGKKPDVKGDSIISNTFAKGFMNKVIVHQLVSPDNAAYHFNGSKHSFFVPQNPFIQEGYSNLLYSEAHTTVRKFTMYAMEDGFPVYSFPAQIYHKYIENFEDIDTTKVNERFINFNTTHFPIVRFDSIAHHPELIKDRIVLVGSTNDEIDQHFTPIGQKSGMEIQAYSLQSLIDQYEIKTLSDLDVWFLAFLATYITELLQYAIISALDDKDNPMAMFLSKSIVFMRAITFFWLGCIAYFAFLLYATQGIFFSTTAVLVAAVLTGEARGIYSSFIKYFHKSLKIPFVKKSIYAK